jgi:nondiscriminating glutamyl-tRNA synthetase
MSLESANQIRVRIAPSPTGMMHVGTARTALFNWLFAKKNNGVFILRIEDTDAERSKKEYEDNILQGLEWLGLDYSEGPFRQSERIDIYRKYINKLLELGSAFVCTHTKEELEQEKSEQASKKEAPRHVCDENLKYKSQNPKLQQKVKSEIIRFKNPGGRIKFKDIIRGEIEFDLELLGDFSIAKDENTPLYNLAAAIDDYDMRISHVIRGEDHISNTPKQLAIYQALGWQTPQFAHVPMILGPDKSKLSKRHGATSVIEYKEQGYLPEAMINFMVLLGWSSQSTVGYSKNEEIRKDFNLSKGNLETLFITNDDIIKREDLVEKFSLEAIQKSGAVFDLKKLDWMNGIYIREKTVAELTQLCLPYLRRSYKVSEIEIEDLEKIVALEQSRLKKLSEIGENTQFFFQEKLVYNKELLKWKETSKDELQEILKKLYDIVSDISEENFTKDKLEEAIMPQAEEIGRVGDKIDRGRALWPLRVALTGQKTSPGPFEVAEILGKEKCLRRLAEASVLND